MIIKTCKIPFMINKKQKYEKYVCIVYTKGENSNKVVNVQ